MIAAHEGGLKKIEMQKKMFLLTRDLPPHEKAPYAFFPYQFGCYSLQCDRDSRTLLDDGLLCKENKRLFARADCIVSPQWRDALQRFVTSAAGKLPEEKLVRHVYQKHPYYAINRKNLEEVLHDDCDRKAVQRARPSKRGRALFTIGYEGLPFEEYVNRLIEEDVRLLVDVRANPLSRKPGFSKGKLREILPNAGIEYKHMPELGIVGRLRRDLPDAESRRRLFADYRARLPGLRSKVEEIYDLMQKHRRIALTCYEADAADCHRHCVSDEMQNCFAGVEAAHL